MLSIVTSGKSLNNTVVMKYFVIFRKRVKMGVGGVEAAERRFPEGVVLKFLSEFNNF